MDKHKILKDIYGYDTFREGQEALIDSTLNQKDALGNYAHRCRKINLFSGSGTFL